MMDEIPLLKFYAKFLQVIGDKKKDEFSHIKNDIDRIRFIYKYNSWENFIITRSCKNHKSAEKLKLDGNNKYATKQFDQAIKLYNEALINCPVVDSDERQLYALIAANLSAVYTEKGEYYKGFLQVNHVLEMNDYPEYSLYKLFMRKGKCARRLQYSPHDVIQYYNQSLKHLEKSRLTETEKEQVIISIKKIVEDIERNMVLCSQSRCNDVQNDYFSIFLPNGKYPALSSKITVAQDDMQGRYIKAVGNITPGEIVALEMPYASVLNRECLRTHCYHCKKRCDIIIPCENCATVLYCSSDCRVGAKSYHNIECGILETIYHQRLSINAHLALRSVTINTVEYFLKGEYKKNSTVESKEKYRYDDYIPIYNLCNHADTRNEQQHLDNAFVSAILLHLLKSTNYFKCSTDNQKLSDIECLIGSLIQKHLQMFEFNAHEIADVIHRSEIELQQKLKEDPLAEAFYTESIGAAVYATLSLFNHSCDPSVARYNNDGNLILRAIKPIKQDEMVYDNYGPLYTTVNKNDRYKYLYERYRFDCICNACFNDFPLYRDLDPNEFKIICRGCKVAYSISDSIVMTNTLCPNNCGVKNTFLQQLSNLKPTADLSLKAEHFYKEKNYQDALSYYGKALILLFENVEPPHTDIIKIQQRIKNCMVNIKNITY